MAKRDDAPGLTVIKPVPDKFVEAFDYRTYRLRKKSQHFDGHVASNVANFVKWLQLQFTKTKLDGGRHNINTSHSKGFWRRMR